MSKMKKLGNIAGKSLFKDDNRGKYIGNLYSGKKMRSTPFVVGGAAAGLAMFGTDLSAGTGMNDGAFGEKTGLMDIKRMTKARQGTLESGEAPVFLADGGSRVNNSLGASGDMVFGMHNRRRG